MGAYMMAAGAALSIVGSIKAGNDAKKLGYAQANNREREAFYARQNAEYAAEMSMLDSQKLIGSQVAAYAASGVVVNTGSPMDVMDETIRNAEMDRYNILREGSLKSSAMRGEADLLRQGGRDSLTGSYLSAGATGFTALSQMGGSKGGSKLGDTPTRDAGSSRTYGVTN